MKKINMLVISDHMFSPSGVGTQTRYMVESLLRTGDYKITYLGEEKNISQNFSSDEVSFRVKNLNQEFNLIAEKRYYPVSKSIMTEAAIYPSIKEDLYISIGDQVEEGWVVKAQLKPFVRLIWLGALIMAFGGFLSLFRFKSL